ncbi:MAG: TIGR00341 family protein [Paludibacteraceae bacterium]
MNTFEKYLAYFKVKSQLEDFDSIHSEIEKGIRFRGTNLWVLMFAIVVASVGLNMNSTAVIIGAMLISPLMGPINGMGYGLATYDFNLFKRAVNNLTFAVLVSLVTSTLYFLITPVSTAHSELLARTSPTIYDVIIAFFGGSAGILAISSKLKGNVIPGVAIATALMPPICTAGYGLATLQFNFFFGAMYLFTINTVFIAVSSILVCKLLDYPIRTIVDGARSKKISRYISAILLTTLVPSIYFGYRLVKQEQFTERTNQFIEQVSALENNFLLRKSINPATQTIQLVYSGYEISSDAVNKVKGIALLHRLDTSKIQVMKSADASVLQESTRKHLSETEVLNRQLNTVKFELTETTRRLDSIKNIPSIGKELLLEIQQLYPQILTCSYAETSVYSDSNAYTQTPMVIFTSGRNLIPTKEREKIVKWLETRLNKGEIITYFE